MSASKHTASFYISVWFFFVEQEFNVNYTCLMCYFLKIPSDDRKNLVFLKQCIELEEKGTTMLTN